MLNHPPIVLKRCSAPLQALPSPATGGRLLLHVPLAAGAKAPRAAKQPREASDKEGGPVLTATVTAVHPLYLEVARGRWGAEPVGCTSDT